MGKDLKGKEIGKGLTQRKDKRYSAKFTTTGGQRIEQYFNTYGEAKLWLSEAKYKDVHGGITVFSKMTVDAWFEEWIKIKESTVRPNTVRNYKERYKINIQPVIGRMRISDVKPIHCQSILNGMCENYKGSTIYQTLMTLVTMFLYAERNRLIDKSPVAKTSVTMPKKVEKKVRFLTLDEQKRFLEAAKNSTNYRQYRLLIETGLRTSEMIGLKWSDVDWEAHTIHVQRNLEYRYSTQEWNFGPTKSMSGNRIIPLTNTVYQMLLEMSTEPGRINGKTPKEFRDIIFINRTGFPTKNSSYDNHIYKLCDKANIERFSMHTLRHTFATRGVEAGMDYKMLSTILGHSNIGITMNLYAHTTEEAKHKEMDKLSAYLSQVS